MDPVVLEKLERFSRRRRFLILLRGACGTVAVWFTAMMLLALVDRFIIMPDPLRLALSIAGYAAAGVVFWLTCGRQMAKIPDTRELAKLIELAAPKLREELLSAVELADDSTEHQWDSEVFRAAVQKITASHVENIQIDSILSRKLISSWLYSALTVVAVFLLLICVPGLRFPQFFFRAMLAGANFERPSEITIKVVSPAPPDRIMPEGDSVPVTVSVSGGVVDRVMLEIFPEGAPRERTVMMLSGQNNFTSTIQLGRETVHYRIRARDAITRKFMLETRPSPQVVNFHKTYRYPHYSKLKSKAVREVSGDVDGLEGTEVDMDIEINQPVREASLQIETGGITNVVPIKCFKSNRIGATIPLKTSGIYKVNLVAAVTFFENKFSPKYEIRVRPDLLPSVKIDLPEQEQVVKQPDGVVNLAGTAKDDLSVTNVEQVVQVNRGQWKSIPLSRNDSNEIKVARNWDLFELNVHPGDQVITKLVATDLKGQRGESAPVRIKIATPGFDPKRLQDVQAKREVNNALHQLRQNAEELERMFNEAKNQAGNNSADQLQKRQALLSAAVAAEALEKQAAETLRKIQETLPQTRAPRESADMALVGNAVSRIARETLPEVKEAIKQATEHTNTNDSRSAQEKLNKANDPFWKALNLSRVADDANRQMLAAEEANLVSRDLQQLKEEQKVMAEQIKAAGNDTNSIERIARRQSVAADETKAVEEQLKTLSEHASGGQEHTIRNWEKELARNRENLEKALGTPETVPSMDTLRPPSEQLQRNVENAANQMQNVRQNLARQADKAREWLQNETGTASDVLANLQRQLERDRDRNNKAPVDQDRLEAAAEQLKDRADLEEKKPNADAQFVADTAKAADAVKALQETSDQSVTNAIGAVKALEENFRKLEAGHKVAELTPALRQLAGQERWEKSDAAETASRARDWDWSEDQMKDLPRKLEQARLPQESAKAMKAITASPEIRKVVDEMRDRASKQDKKQNISEPLDQMAGEIAQIKQQLQPVMEQARSEIERVTPGLSDRLEGLAKAAEKMEKATEAQLENAGKAENTDKVAREAGKLAEAQEKLDNKIEDVKEALRRDANVQNMATEEGRARARDADDANAMLRQQTPDAADMLQQAAAAAQPAKQKEALKTAGDQQEKLADNLQKLAEHYKNMEEGKASEASRTALREAEKETGLKSVLDSEYQKAQALEALAGKSQEAQLAELEKALQVNDAMRRELGDIAKDTLGEAASSMQQAEDKEQKIAADIGKAVKAEQQQGSTAEQAKRISEKAQKMVREEIPSVAKQSEKAGINNKQELDRASEALSSAAKDMPTDFSQQSEKIAGAMNQQADRLQHASGELNNAANKAQPGNEQQKSAQQQAQQASQQANEMAQQARQLANALRQMHSAADQQPVLEQAMREAGNDIERAGRHEARLGREFMGTRLQQLGQQVKNQTAGQIDKTEQALDNANAPAQAQPAAEAAKDAIAKPLDQLESAMKQLPPQVPEPSQQSSESQLASASEDAAKWMARALDTLDSKINPAKAAENNRQNQKNKGKGDQQSSNTAQDLARAVQSAAEAQADAMKDARSNNMVPGEQPISQAASQGGGAKARALAVMQGKLPEAVVIRGDWGKLPPKLAKDLLDSQREGVGGEYREQVNLYFKAIADKAKGQKK